MQVSSFEGEHLGEHPVGQALGPLGLYVRMRTGEGHETSADLQQKTGTSILSPRSPPKPAEAEKGSTLQVVGLGFRTIEVSEEQSPEPMLLCPPTLIVRCCTCLRL